MSILIVYGSAHGQTRKVAEFLAERFRGQSQSVELYNAARMGRGPDPADFDMTVVASPVRMGAYRPSIVRFVRRHLDALTATRTAFVSVSMAAAGHRDGETMTAMLQNWVNRFCLKTGWTPAQVLHVAGALPYTRYNFITRSIMRRIAESQGDDTDISRDYEYTDWAALGHFADSFAAGRPVLAHAA